MENEKFTKFVVRMPPELHEQIALIAKDAKRSMNSEIVSRLEKSLVGTSDEEIRVRERAFEDALKLFRGSCEVRVPVKWTLVSEPQAGRNFGENKAMWADAHDQISTGSGIKALRERLGLTQADFAAELGASQGRVSKWENDIETPDGKATRALVILAKREMMDGND